MISAIQAPKTPGDRWFYPGWIHGHILATAGVSLVWAFLAPSVFGLYMGLTTSYVPFLSVFFVSSLVAVGVSGLFGGVLYPLMQWLLAPVLRQVQKPGEAWSILLPAQQALVWAIPVGMYVDMGGRIGQNNHELFLFWILVSVHAAVHLRRYTMRTWEHRLNSLSLATSPEKEA